MLNNAVRALLFTSIVVAACSPAAWDSDVDGTEPPKGAAPGGKDDCNAPAKLEAIDPSSLPACCATGATGKAHCMPKEKTPMGYRSAMAECNGGGSCIPDALVKSGGAKPPSCKSTLLGKVTEGACLSVCIPQIAAKKDLLNKGDCTGEDEVCAPCINPLDGKTSGACEIGQNKSTSACGADGGAEGGAAGGGGAGECPYKGPPADVTKFPMCDVAGARCVPEATVQVAVSEQQRAMLAKCDKGGPGFCVPEPILKNYGKYVPPTCTSVNDNEGRCLHVSIPFVAGKKDLLPPATCGADERCVPCTDPITGKETGACKLSCDPGPTKAAKPFASCCGGRAKCVPKGIVPASLQDKMTDEGCKADEEKCLPTEVTDKSYKPQACKANFFAGGVAGVCLSNCLQFPFPQSLGVTRETCDKDSLCVPCTTGGKPSGAPGCN